ncbi:hypothetical protein [Streptomyces sp. NPDC048551]|uniref:hypothetical protein n=1 Tax=Streptomyces sp. NPDC048551 TaxID=3155758 RepID=UPI00343A4045
MPGGPLQRGAGASEHTPLLAGALAAGGPGRADAAFDLALTALLSYAAALRAP